MNKYNYPTSVRLPENGGKYMLNLHEMKCKNSRIKSLEDNKLKSAVALKFLKLHPDYHCLILVPEQNNIQNWLDEFNKFNVPTDNVQIYCYASFYKFRDTQWDLLVFDEVPHTDTEKRLAVCKTVKADYILALGAVVTESERRALEDIYGRFRKSVIGFSSAIKMDLLPSPKVFVAHLDMDTKEKSEYLKIHQEVDRAVSAFNGNPNEWNKRKMLQAGSKRKRFLGSLKEEALAKICGQFNVEGKRFLCFCSSIKQANKLGGELAFTSETPTSRKLIDKFNNHEINSLYVVGKLIEGQNLKDIDCGVIGQLGGTDRITVQSIGRIMRSDNPVIYVPVFDGTKDDGFLSTLTDNVPAKYIEHYKFNQVN